MISVSGCMFLLPGQLFLLTTPHVQGPPVIHPLSGNLQCTTARSKGASGVRGGGGGGDEALRPSAAWPTASVGFLLSGGCSSS